MIINRSNLTAIFTSFSTIFREAFQTAQPLWSKIATLVPSSTGSMDYKWLGKVPRMREWVGERVIANLSAFSYTIKNKDWESTVAVDRNDVEDDTIGLYQPVVRALGESAAMHPDEIVFALLAAGFTTACFDGQYFFDSDHPTENGGVQSNLGTAALSATSYAAARAAMMALKDDKGKPLNIRPKLLVVPPQLEKTALEIVVRQRDANGADNVYAGSAEVLVVPELSANPTAWYLLDTTKAIKPVIFQQRSEPKFVSKDSPTDDNVFMKKEFVYGVDARDNAGYGLWQLAYGSTGAGE